MHMGVSFQSDFCNTYKIARPFIYLRWKIRKNKVENTLSLFPSHMEQRMLHFSDSCLFCKRTKRREKESFIYLFGANKTVVTILIRLFLLAHNSTSLIEAI